MKVISVNTNGIRAASRKGFFDWLAEQQADFVCIQETKAQVDQLTDEMFHPDGYHCAYFDALKKGYSGTAVYSPHQPLEIIRGYGDAIADSGIQFDLLFGPAYKGIPLAAITASALYQNHQLDIPYAFDRKEVKDHGEGGQIVGADIEGRIMVIDDVITAGTAIRQSMALIESLGAQVTALTVALDRQEKGQGELSAIQELEQEGIQVIPIIRLQHIMQYLEEQGDIASLEKIRAYRQQYGTN